MKVIFDGSYFEAMIVRNLLENDGIKVFAQNEFLSNIDPWGVAAGGLNPLKLQVNEDDFEKAKQIVDNYREQKSTD
jgi:hypothetical protein